MSDERLLLAVSSSPVAVFERLLRRNFLSMERENPESSDFAATIINQFAGADAQNAITSGSNRPNRVAHLYMCEALTIYEIT